MKNIILAVVVCAVTGLNAGAYFDGGVTATSGPGGYKGTKLDLVIGTGNLAFEPSLTSYVSDAVDKTFTYALRGAWEAEKYTVAGFAGTTPEVNDYSNKFFGGDITYSLTPGRGGRSRLAGPGSRGGAHGGQGITRIDVGAGIKQTMHTKTGVGDTNQTEGSLFAGAKIFMVNLSGSFTAYAYGAEKTVPQGFVTGLNFSLEQKPKSSVNVKLDLPGQPLVTPFISYTGIKIKGGGDTSAYLLGAYIDLSMVVANATYQIYDSGSARNSFITLGAGVKF